MSNLMSADQAASAAAEAMFGKSGGGGGMPLAQGEAEGGLSSKAPGKPLASKAKKAAKPEEDEDEDKKAPPWAKKSMAKAEEEEEDEGEGEEKESPEKEKREEAAAEKKDAKERGEPSEDEDEEKSDDSDADDMKKKKACKSEVEESDLMKALDVLEAVAAGMDEAVDRRSELAGKLAEGTIAKSEESELRELLGEVEEEQLDKSFAEIFANDEQLRTDYEISPFIERNSQLMAEGLDFLRATIEKSGERQGTFNNALAKSFRAIGAAVVDQMDLIKSQQVQIRALGERLGIVESSPMPRKARSGTAAPLAKSFAGGNEGQLGREQIMDGLNRLMAKSSHSNFLAPCGESIERAVAMYETSGVISRSLLGDVQAELKVK